MTKSRLREQLAGKRTALKTTLMDQAVVAGLGNLVTDEVLWRARVHPGRRPGSLAPPEWDRLDRALGSVLRASVRAGRVPARASWLTGVRDKRHPVCTHCQTALRRTRSGGRATLWCPACQPRSP